MHITYVKVYFLGNTLAIAFIASITIYSAVLKLTTRYGFIFTTTYPYTDISPFKAIASITFKATQFINQQTASYPFSLATPYAYAGAKDRQRELSALVFRNVTYHSITKERESLFGLFLTNENTYSRQYRVGRRNMR